MALLSAGTSLEIQGLDLDAIQTPCDNVLDFGLTTPLHVEVDKKGDESDSEVFTFESGLTQAGNISPVYSPNSVLSVDSGILPSVSDEDYLLSSLFGFNFDLPSLTAEVNVDCDTLVEQSSLSPSELNSVSSIPNQGEKNSQDQKMSKESVNRSRKNADAARLNRQKKKQYVESLEKKCSGLKTENVLLKTRCHEYQQRCQRLLTEVEYLKSVIVNESALSSLIQNIPQVKEVNLSSSFSRKRTNPESNSQANLKRFKTESFSGGVCLHVAKDVVSLEFCANCSKQAAS